MAGWVRRGSGNHDPFWDLDGKRVRRDRVRQRVVAMLAFVLAVAAVGATSVTWAKTVLGASTTVNLDQWAPLEHAWQNGNLNATNARYPEGGVVPFRLAIEGASVGEHTIHINYDFTASGHKAYDFLATWNATNGPSLCAMSGGGVSSKCPSLGSPSSFAFPSDPYVADGLKVSGAQSYSAASRRLTIYGGSITSISGPVHSGSAAANSSADYVVHFHATRAAVLLAWGGHLAQSGYWNSANGGGRDGASMVSGAPWHMRTLQLDGTGNKNQDRSISPSAVVGELPPGGAAPTPSPTPKPTPRPTPPPAAPAAPGEPGVLPSPPPTDTPIDQDALWTSTIQTAILLGVLLSTAITYGVVRSSPRRRRRWSHPRR